MTFLAVWTQVVKSGQGIELRGVKFFFNDQKTCPLCLSMGQHFVMSIFGGRLMAAYLQISGLFSFMPKLKRSLATIRLPRLLSK
jgi:hypothetical protein